MLIYIFSKIVRVFLLLTFTLFLVTLACAPRAAQAPEIKVVEKPEVPEIKAKLSWEQKWENLIKAAREEKKVYIRTARSSEVWRAAAKAFKDKFGIELESETGKGAETLPKTLTERHSGLFIVDIYEGGASIMLSELKARKMIESLDNLVFHPDVLDKNLWRGSAFGPFFDKDHTVASGSGNVSPPILVNSGLVSIEEMKSLNDLINPKWRGKIIMGDPTVSGGQQSAVIGMMMIMGEDFLIKLVEQQKPVITRDKAQLVDWVAKGKYPIAVGASSEIIGRYKSAGAALLPIMPIEGAETSTATVMVLMKDAPHPKAAQLFMNWILTSEGQSIFYEASGFASRRVDVSNEWVGPEYKMQPNIKYLIKDEDSVLKEDMYVDRLRKIFNP